MLDIQRKKITGVNPIHGKVLHFNNEENKEGNSELNLLLVDDNGETKKGIVLHYFPILHNKNIMFKNLKESSKEYIFYSITRIAPLLFECIEIRYFRYYSEKNIGSYIDKDRQKDLFDDHFVFRTEYFEQGDVTMRNSLENVNFVAQLLQHEERKDISIDTFQNVLIKYLNSFLINSKSKFKPNKEFEDFYKTLKFI